MDERLNTTARSGDVDVLHTLIHDDPDVFKRIDEMDFIDTPLHVSAASGNTGFAIKMMNLKPSFARKLNQDGFFPIHLALLKDHADTPSFARKLNQDGFSPIHLALLKDHADTVTEFVLVDRDLIRVKGREGFTVLHYVACHGNVQLLSRFTGLQAQLVSRVWLPKAWPTRLTVTRLTQARSSNPTPWHSPMARVSRPMAARLDMRKQWWRRPRLPRRLQQPRWSPRWPTPNYTQLQHPKLPPKHPRTRERGGGDGVEREPNGGREVSKPNLVNADSKSNGETRLCSRGREEVAIGGDARHGRRWRLGRSFTEDEGCGEREFSADDRAVDRLHGELESSEQRETVADNRESLRVLSNNPIGFQEKMAWFETVTTDYFRELKPDTINALLVVLALVQNMTYQAILSLPGGVSDGGAGGSNHPEGKSVLNCLMFLCYQLAIWFTAPSDAPAAVSTVGVIIIVTLFYWIRGNRMLKH
ncbi:hypothetical protein GQ457_10G004160 [Hibiscus cannabinus]